MAEHFYGWLFPEELRLIPDNAADPHGWVVTNFSYYDAQWIKCSYPISGGYAPTPRYIYYALILVALRGRKTSWLTNTALGLVMTISSAAAVHGLILAIIRRDMAPAYLYENDNWEAVQVDGPGFANYMSNMTEFLANKATGELWLPVLPMVWDNDGDPILAIVGAAFLILLPMQTWSSTLRDVTKAKKVLVGLWSCLLLVGLVSALIYVEYTWVWAFPQLRFCPPGHDDALPFKNGGPYQYPGGWIPGDWYRWNRILGEQFVYKNATTKFPNTCLYPCLQFEWLLRDPEDIYVSEEPPDIETPGMSALVAVYYVVTSSCFCNILLLLATKTDTITNAKWGLHPDLIDAIRERRFRELWKQTWMTGTYGASRCRWVWRGLVAFVFLYVSLFTIVMSPITLVAFVAYCEWLMWIADPGVETFRHVGQWSALVGTVLVVASAVGLFFAGRRAQSASKGTAEIELQDQGVFVRRRHTVL